MPGIAEPFTDHRPLVDRCRHKHVYIPVADILDSSLKGCHRALGRLRSSLSRLHEHILGQAVDNIYPFLVYILCRSYHIGVDRLVKIVYLLAVKTEYLGRTIDYGSAELQHPLIGKSLDYDLITYSVAVSLSYSYNQFLSHIPYIFPAVTAGALQTANVTIFSRIFSKFVPARSEAV